MTGRLDNKSKLKNRLSLMVLCIALASGCATVPPGHTGVLWKAFGGTQAEPYGEGRHPVACWNRMYVYDLRESSHDEAMNVIAIDGVPILLNLSVRYRLIAKDVIALHEQIGLEYYPKVLLPILLSEMKRVTSRYTPEEIYSTKRDVIEQECRTGIMAKLEGQHVAVEAVFIRNILLPPSIQQGIDKKVAAAQEVLRMPSLLQVAKATAERHRIEAQEVADSNRTVAPSLNASILEYERTRQITSLAASANAKTVLIGPGGHGTPIMVTH